MYVCNTGLECEDCIGGCEKNLEWEDEDLTILTKTLKEDNEIPDTKNSG